MKELLEYLGPKGMSSEDTCMEGLEVVYRVHILGWHHNIEKVLNLIDSQ